MDIKDILLFLRAEAPCSAQIRLAARLAGKHDAELNGVCLFAEPALPLADAYAIGPAAVGDVLADQDRRLRGIIAPIEAAFRRESAENGCRSGWSVTGPDEPLPLSALRARFADLVIGRRPEPHEHARGDLASTLAIAGGTPCLFVPDTSDGENAFERILLAWNGSREAKHALDDALVFLTRASAVEILIIDGETTSQTDERSGDALLLHLMHHGVRAGLRRVRRFRGDAGEAILQGCRTFAADLLVMGAYGHSRAAEAVLGGATRTALSHSPIPVMTSH